MSRSVLIISVFVCFVALCLSGSASHAARHHTIRVMTYNIHVGIGMDKKLDLARIAKVINDQKPDLVGLQEVDRGVQRTQRIDEIAELARLTKMDYAFAFNLPYQGGQYGVAILSRFRITATEHRHYKNLREAERRGFIRAEVLAHGQKLNFVTTHLDYQYEDGRVFETEQLLEGLKDVQGPLIVVGDFNDIPTGGAYKLMAKEFYDSWMHVAYGQWLDGTERNEGLTYPADKPAKRIDYIFTRRSDGIRIKRAWIVETLASDHVPVVADLEIGLHTGQ